MSPKVYERCVLVVRGLADGLTRREIVARTGLTSGQVSYLLRNHINQLSSPPGGKPVHLRAKHWLNQYLGVDAKFVPSVSRGQPVSRVEVSGPKKQLRCRYYLPQDLRECGHPSFGRTYCEKCQVKTLNPNERSVFSAGIK